MCLTLAAAAVRVVLVQRGGQFFFPDESRYQAARDAAAMIAHGQWKQGLAHPFVGGDHVGFKFMGVVPAFMERSFGQNNQIPASYFAFFSWLAIPLLGLLARQLGATTVQAAWVMVAASTSATLFYYARHLLPYDTALTLALLALWVGLRSRGWFGWTLAGAIAAWAFLCYYGYWLLVGVCGLLVVLRASRGWRDALARASAAGVGAVAAVALPISVEHVWGRGNMVHGARTLSESITAGDYRGHIVPWEFLWSAEALWLLAAWIGVAVAMVEVRRQWRLGQRWALVRSPEALGLLAVTLIWVVFIVTANGLEKFVVHGRLARQLTPFLALLLGFGLAKLVQARRPRWTAAVLSLLVLNAVYTFAEPLRLRFPGSFRAEWDPLLVEASRESDGTSYHRLVNVTSFIFEPEMLEREPARTVAAAPHPYSFVPYLYEGMAPAERQRRQAIDHRMRLVEMDVPANERITGAAYGVVKLGVRFKPGRGGFPEPLLSVGTRRDGHLFFVRYLSDTLVEFGFESWGEEVFVGPRVQIELGREYTIECFSGALLPEPSEPSPPELQQEHLELSRLHVWIRLDGEEVLNRFTASRSQRPQHVFAGVNVVDAGSAGSRFQGEITAAERGGLPPPPASLAEGDIGPLLVLIEPPSAISQRPEPLVVVGDPGRAVLAYMVMIEPRRARFGVEIWGVGAWESQPVRLSAAGKDEMVCSFGTLLPKLEAPEWGSTSEEERRRHVGQVRVQLNGKTVLEFASATPPRTIAQPFAVGENPIGGSHVLPTFTGRVLHWEFLPLDRLVAGENAP
jgi:hypothetical protein